MLPEELKVGSRNLKLLLIGSSSKLDLQLGFGGFLEATKKVSLFSEYQKMTPWEVIRIYRH